MRPKLIPMSPMFTCLRQRHRRPGVIVRRPFFAPGATQGKSIFRKDVLDAVHTIVDASETIANNWQNERYADISRSVVEFIDRKRRHKSPLPAFTREQILTYLLIVTRTGIEAVQDYQGGDYPGLAKDVLKLAKTISKTRRP